MSPIKVNIHIVTEYTRVPFVVFILLLEDHEICPGLHVLGHILYSFVARDIERTDEPDPLCYFKRPNLPDSIALVFVPMKTRHFPPPPLSQCCICCLRVLQLQFYNFSNISSNIKLGKISSSRGKYFRNFCICIM